MSVQDDLAIDPFRLDEQWAELPTLFHAYSERSDEADSLVRSCKLRIERITAELDSDIRLNFKDYGFTAKPTENAIKANIASNKEVLKANEEMLKHEKEKKLCQSVARALEIKKDAMKNLVQLYTSEYYSAPASSEDGKKFLERQASAAKQDVRKGVKESLKRNRKKKEA